MSDLNMNMKSINGKNDVGNTNNCKNRVSKKFLKEINERIRNTIDNMGYDISVYIVACKAIIKYISDGIEPEVGELLTARMIFHLLKPEIDKAMARSRAARKRAAARRSAKSKAFVEEPRRKEKPVIEPIYKAQSADTSNRDDRSVMCRAIHDLSFDPADKPNNYYENSTVDLPATQLKVATELTVEQDMDSFIDKFNDALKKFVPEESYLRPLSRHERRDLKRRLLKAKKRRMVC